MYHPDHLDIALLSALWEEMDPCLQEQTLYLLFSLGLAMAILLGVWILLTGLAVTGYLRDYPRLRALVSIWSWVLFYTLYPGWGIQLSAMALALAALLRR